MAKKSLQYKAMQETWVQSLGQQDLLDKEMEPTPTSSFASWKKSYDKPRQHIKKQRHYFANKSPSSQSYGFSSSHVWMWELEFLGCWVLSQLFHYPLSLSSRGFLVPLWFLHKGGIIYISEVIYISHGNLDSSLCFIHPAFCMMYSERGEWKSCLKTQHSEN